MAHICRPLFESLCCIDDCSNDSHLCGLECPGVEGAAPDLHCSVCMCLFHRSCVGMPFNIRGRYVCQVHHTYSE